MNLRDRGKEGGQSLTLHPVRNGSLMPRISVYGIPRAFCSWHEGPNCIDIPGLADSAHSFALWVTATIFPKRIGTVVKWRVQADPGKV